MLRRRKVEYVHLAMLIAVLILQVLLLLALVALIARRAPRAEPDPRLAELPAHLATLAARHDDLRTVLAELRRESGEHARGTIEANGRAFNELRAELVQTVATNASSLRHEVTGSIGVLAQTLKSELAAFRHDNAQAAAKLQSDVQQQHETITHKLGQAAAEARLEQNTARETLHTRLNELAAANQQHQERLRATVGESLATLNADNTAKLEQMRITVDEKLNATLHSRLTESFGQVTDQLNKVHTGLGEMSKLSEGVDDLSRIFSNVKSRGGFAEVQLGMLLDQMLAPGQFVRNARVKPNTQELVEFAVRFPGQAGESTLLPIDAKFPREAWERLETAYTANDPEALATAGKAFEAAIRTEGKRICEKYINPPLTTPHAIMFLPTEGLYAEVMRRDSLQAEIQQNCQVTIAGPSTLSAILTSFQMGFHMLALQEKGDEVWKVLARAKTEFNKFGTLMEKVEGDVGKIQKTLGEVGVRTRAINRSLREVSDAPGNVEQLVLDDLGAATLHLVAAGEEN